jgi:purine-binding chemotaxis protein CheW
MSIKAEKFQILTWYIGKQLFGMELASCREVVQDRHITTVPYAKENVAGIVNLRGDVVTVLDLGVMLGYSDK